MLYKDHCITIPASPDCTPPPPSHAPCALGITISGYQYAHSTHDYSRVWLVDDVKGSYLVYIAECRGVAGDYVIYRFHGCRDFGIDPKAHESCPYGLLRVAKSLVHPSVDIDALPTSTAIVQDAATHWATIMPLHHYTLVLAYPPGYCEPNTTPVSFRPSPDDFSFRIATPIVIHTGTSRDSLDSDSPTVRGRQDNTVSNAKPVIVDTLKGILQKALTLRGIRRGKSGTNLRSQ